MNFVKIGFGVCMAAQVLSAAASSEIPSDEAPWVLWGKGDLKVTDLASGEPANREWSGWWNACSGDAQIDVKKRINGKPSAGAMLAISSETLAFRGDLGIPAQYENEAWEERQFYFMELERTLNAVLPGGMPTSDQPELVDRQSAEPLRYNGDIILAAPWHVTGSVTQDGATLRLNLHVVAGDQRGNRANSGFQDLRFEGDLTTLADRHLDGHQALGGWRLYGEGQKVAAHAGDAPVPFRTVDDLRAFLKTRPQRPADPTLCAMPR